MATLNVSNIVKNINPLKLRYPGTGLTYEQVLRSEANRLKQLIQDYMYDYLTSYSPVMYERSAPGIHGALTVDDICEISSTGAKIAIKINDNAIGHSVFDGNPSNKLWLISEGWQVRDGLWFSDIYRFGYFEGAHFIEDAVDEFNRTNKYNIRVEINRPLLYY